MRELGTIQSDADATRFNAYLITLGIATHVERTDEGWTLWIVEEDQVSDARLELAAFLALPHAQKYDDAIAKAAEQQSERILDFQQSRLQLDAEERTQKIVLQKNTPVVFTLILLSAFITVLSEWGKNDNVTRALAFADKVDIHEGKPYSFNVQKGQVWRVVTPVFVHQSWWIVFNFIVLMWLGSRLERNLGSIRFAVAILAITAFTNFVQAASPYEVGGGFKFGGMTGLVYGLFGYIWVKARREPESGLILSRFAVLVLLSVLLSASFNSPYPIHSVARFSGMIAGFAMAITPTLFRQR